MRRDHYTKYCVKTKIKQTVLRKLQNLKLFSNNLNKQMKAKTTVEHTMIRNMLFAGDAAVAAT